MKEGIKRFVCNLVVVTGTVSRSGYFSLYELNLRSRRRITESVPRRRDSESKDGAPDNTVSLSSTHSVREPYTQGGEQGVYVGHTEGGHNARPLPLVLALGEWNESPSPLRLPVYRHQGPSHHRCCVIPLPSLTTLFLPKCLLSSHLT